MVVNANEIETRNLITYTDYYGSCDDKYRYMSLGGGNLEFGCDKTLNDESFSYYRRSGTDSYSAYVKSSSNDSKHGDWTDSGDLSKVQTPFKAGDQVFGCED